VAAPPSTGTGAPSPSARAAGGDAERPVPRVRVRAPGEPRKVAYLYLAPAFLFYLLFAFGPLVYTAWLSLFDWDGLTVGTWTGLDNYRKVLSDPDIRASFVHSFELIFFYAILPVLLGLFLASVIAHGRARGVTFFRAVLFLPQTVATVVVANAWVFSVVTGTAQSIALAEKLGLDPQLFLETIAGGALDAPYVQLKGRAMVAGDYPPAFAVDGALKDSGLIAEALRATGGDDRLITAVNALFADAAAGGRAGEDMAAVAEVFRR